MSVPFAVRLAVKADWIETGTKAEEFAFILCLNYPGFPFIITGRETDWGIPLRPKGMDK